MNKQEVISKLKSAIPKNNIDDYQRGEAAGLNFALLLLAELDEPVRPPEPKQLELKKPVVPQFVADWYEENKYYFEWNLYNFCVDFHEGKVQEDLREWFADNTNEPIETLVMMHKFGYEVEKEKLYTVELPNPNSFGFGSIILRRNNEGKIYISFSVFNRKTWRCDENAQLTESEIKQDFAWAWKFAEEVEE